MVNSINPIKKEGFNFHFTFKANFINGFSNKTIQITAYLPRKVDRLETFFIIG